MVDNYRGRIIFPIHNNTGKTIGFGARIIGKNDKAPKYINTPENEIYIKSKILYGSYFARMAIDRADECLLVEGYTDVVSLHQAGIENVVASGGTSLTIDQLRLVKKYTNNLTIIYDGDNAGIKAALRGLDLALEEGLNVRLVLIPDGEDPDSYVNKTGAKAFNEFVAANKKDFIIFQLAVLLKEAGNDVTRKSTVVNQLAETLSKINKAEDFTRQQDYIRQCAALLKIDEAGFTNLVNKFKRDKISKEEKKLPFEEANIIAQGNANKNYEPDSAEDLLQQDDIFEKNILKILFEHGLKPFDETKTIADYIFSELNQFHFSNVQLEAVLQVYQQLYHSGQQPTNKTLIYHEQESVRNIAIEVGSNQYELSSRWDEKLGNKESVHKDNSVTDAQLSIAYYKLRKFQKMFYDLMRDMEKASYEEQLQIIGLHKELQTYEHEITRLRGTVIKPK